MNANSIPDEVVRLIHGRIESVMELEALLLLHARTQDEWRADDLARTLYLDAAAAGGLLSGLARRGLIGTRHGGPQLTFVYEPSTPEVARAVDRLAEVYATRRVAITGLIYAKPEDPMQDFSDAFRLRRDR